MKIGDNKLTSKLFVVKQKKLSFVVGAFKKEAFVEEDEVLQELVHFNCHASSPQPNTL